MTFGTVYVRLALLAGLLLATYGIHRLARRGTYQLWRRGYDPARRLAYVTSLVSLASLAAVGTVAFFWVAVPAMANLPLWAALALSGVAILAALPFLQNLVAGLYLGSRRELREGDEIRLGEVTGVVGEVGLLRLRLRKADGTHVSVPNRLALQSPLEVQRATGRARIIVDVDLGDVGPTTMEIVREAALLCPYRVPETPVHVRPHRGTLHVELEAWRPRCQQEVGYYLHAAYQRGQ